MDPIESQKDCKPKVHHATVRNGKVIPIHRTGEGETTWVEMAMAMRQHYSPTDPESTHQTDEYSRSWSSLSGYTIPNHESLVPSLRRLNCFSPALDRLDDAIGVRDLSDDIS
ncbi:hypothetical protein ALUC_61131A [Aspergillus luchuensis]|nr:hypothetical protein ALUC_61131A [Aspergillus luchuensis]